MSNTDVFGVVQVMVEDQVAKANAIAEEVQKSRVNVGKVVHEIRKDENTTDERVKAFQKNMEKASAQIEKWTKEIDEYIKTELVQTSSMTDEAYEAKKAEYAELKKGINAALKLAANLPGYVEGETFKSVTPLQTLSGGTSGAATGTKRPRLASLTIDGEEIFTVKKTDEGDVKSYTFTAAAAHLSTKEHKVNPSDLSAAAFAAAGTDDLSTVNDVEFVYSVGDKDFSFTVIPAQGK